MNHEPSWREVIGAEDAHILARYARPRPAFAGVAPILLVIDVTEAFVGPNLPVAQAQEVSRQACGERAWATLPPIRRLLETFRTAGHPVIFTAPDPAQRWVGAATAGQILPAERPDGQVLGELAPRDGEMILVKSKSSAFFGTPLLSALIQTRRDTVVIVGGTTSGCVRATAVDAASHGFEVLVIEDACFDRVALSHAVALIDLDVKYARIINSFDLPQMLPGAG